MASVVVALFVFTRFGRSRPGFEMNKLAFMLIITAALVVLDTDVGFDFVPVIRSVVKNADATQVQVQSYILRPGPLPRK